MIVAMMASFSLAGCKEEVEEEAAIEEAAPIEKEAVEEAQEELEGLEKFRGQTLHILAQSHPPMQESHEYSAERLKELYDINVIIGAAAYSEMFSKAMTNFIGKTGAYDIIDTANEWTGEWAEGKYLEPLDEWIANDPDFDLSIYIESFWKYTGEWKGIQYMIPFNSEAVMPFYNKDVLEKLGKDIPTTWAEYKDLAKSIAENPEFEGIYPSAEMYCREQALTIFHPVYLEILDNKYPEVREISENGYWDDNTFQNVFNVEAAEEALQYLLDLMDYNPPGALQNCLPESSKLFLDGKAAMVNMWPLVIAMASEDPGQSNVVGKVVTAVQPGGNAFGGGWGLCITSDSKNKELAWEYIKWHRSPENQKFFFEEFGVPPSITSAYEDPELKEKYYFWEVFGDNLAKTVNMGRISGMAAIIGGDMNTHANQVMSEELTPLQAAEMMKNDITTVLEDNGYPQQ